MMAPTPFALVCFRACPSVEDEAADVRATLDALNEAIMHGVNATGKALLSHTKLNDKLRSGFRLETSARLKNT